MLFEPGTWSWQMCNNYRYLQCYQCIGDVNSGSLQPKIVGKIHGVTRVGVDKVDKW